MSETNLEEHLSERDRQIPDQTETTLSPEDKMGLDDIKTEVDEILKAYERAFKEKELIVRNLEDEAAKTGAAIPEGSPVKYLAQARLDRTADKTVLEEIQKIKKQLNEGLFKAQGGKVRVLLGSEFKDVKQYIRDLALRTGHTSGKL